MKKTNKKAKPSDHKKYNPVGSLVWALKRMWKMTSVYCLSFFVFIPISILTSVIRDYFPKVLIDALGSGHSFGRIAILVVLFMWLLCAIQVLDEFLLSRRFAWRLSVTGQYQMEIWRKDCLTDCENLDRQYYRRIKDYANGDTRMGNAAVEFFWGDLASFLVSVLGIATYASLMTAVNPDRKSVV